MSHALQCTQLAALICRRLPPASSSTISYTCAGQNRVQGLPYSVAQVVAQMFLSRTLRCVGCTSSCAVVAKNTELSRSRGGRSRVTQCRLGDSYSASFSSGKVALFRKVHGV